MAYGIIGPRASATDPAENMLFLLLGVFAVFTLSYDIAVLVPISLRDVTIITAAACLLPLGALIRSTAIFLTGFARYCGERAREAGSWFLLACCLAAGAIALLANRPDADDSFYLARAVLDWENWTSPIVPVYPFAFTEGSGTRFTSLPSWEHFAGAIAGLTGSHPLTIHHLVLPALAGAAVPYAWFCALTRISHTNRAALAGVAAILLLMLLDGTTHRGVAYFGLLRIWQGKVVLTAVIAPLAIAVALDTMRHGRPADWVRLLLLGFVAMGLSTTAAFYLPILVGLAAGSFWLVYLPPTRIWQPPLAALAVFAYPALAVVPFYRGLAGGDALFPSVIASNLHEILLIVFGTVKAPTVIALGAAVIGLALARRSRLLGWFTLWTAALAVPLAWPPAADFIVARLTSTDAMWRLAYAGPVLLAIGAGIGALIELRPLRLLVPLGLAGGYALAMFLALRGLPPSPFVGLRFPTLALKIEPGALTASRLLLDRLPAGRLLAPRELSTVLPMLSGRQRLANFREFDAPKQLVFDGRRKLGEELALAHDWISGLPFAGDPRPALAAVMRAGLDTVVLSPATANLAAAETVVVEEGFQRLDLPTSYLVFRRPGG
ncbi:MAG: DUF6077 domain-containing protein [Alphaproteobacteria bacterium]|nr:DUF6077 domain-containing protein [Alphaproteobacteria bacterium]